MPPAGAATSRRHCRCSVPGPHASDIASLEQCLALDPQNVELMTDLGDPYVAPAHYRPRYHWSTPGPTVAARAAPTARKQPNGSIDSRWPLRIAIIDTPTSEPESDAKTNVGSARFHPRNAQIRASIFGSP